MLDSRCIETTSCTSLAWRRSSTLPLGLVTALLTSVLFSGTVLTPTDLFTEAGSIRPEAIAAGVIGAGTLALLSAAASLFSTAALLYAAHARLAGRTPGIVAAYRNSLRRVPSLLGAYVLSSLAFLGMFLPAAILIGVAAFLISEGNGGATAGGIALILLGTTLVFAGVGVALLFYIRWWFFKQAVVLESYGPVSALSRSADLVRDRWWKTFGFAILLNLLTSALSLTPRPSPVCRSPSSPACSSSLVLCRRSSTAPSARSRPR